jgi:hypothetical protein
MTPPIIEQIQPRCFFKLLSEQFFSTINIFRLREKRLSTEKNQALKGLGGLRPGALGGLTIDVPMPALRVPDPNAPGPVVIIEQRFITCEEPTLNMGPTGNGTGISSEQCAVAILQTFHQAGDEFLGLSWYPDSRPYEPLPLEAGRPFLGHKVTMLAKMKLTNLPKMPLPGITDDGNGNITLTDTSGLLDNNGNPAKIYYTTDGSFPGPGSTPAATAYLGAGNGGTAKLYTGPFQVANGTNVQWAAYLVPSLYLGSDPGSGIVSCNPPVLSAAGSGETVLSWTYGGLAPFFWQVYVSSDNSTWNEVAPEIAGATLSYTTAVIEKYWRVQGTDSNGNPVTPMSNSVYYL